MMNNKSYILALILILLTPKTGYSLDKWDQILENALKDIPKLEITDKNNRNQLIAHYEIGEKQEIVSRIDSYLDKQYDPILMSIYLSHTLFYDREELPLNTKKRLEMFRENEYTKSSIPDLLISYYYFLKSEYQTSISFLKNANKINLYSDFSQERKKIAFNYFTETTGNKIYSLSNSSFITPEIPYFLLHMSREMKNSANNEFKKELTIYATSMYINSNNLFNLTSSIYVITDCIDKTEHHKLYDLLEKEKKQMPRFTNFVQESLKNSEGKDTFVEYMETVYALGELKAIDTYFPYQYDSNVDTKKEHQTMIMRIKTLYDQIMKEL